MLEKWYVIAGQDAAKIYIRGEADDQLIFLKKWVNPLSHERKRTLVRKQAGWGVRSLGHMGVARHIRVKRSDPHEMALVQFARQISDYLYQEKQKKNYGALTVAAEPHFLGKIKSTMNLSVQKSVTQWVRKDLQKLSLTRLSKALLVQKPKTERL